MSQLSNLRLYQKFNIYNIFNYYNKRPKIKF